MQRLIMVIVVLVLFCTGASAEKIRIFGNKGHNMVPLRYVADWVGAGITAGGESTSVTVSLGGKSVTIKPNSTVVTGADNPPALMVTPLLRDNVLYVPVSMFGNLFGIGVRYDAELQCVVLTNPLSASLLMLPITPSGFHLTGILLDILNFRRDMVEGRIRTSVNAGMNDGYGMTPLHYAAMLSDTGMMGILAGNGGDVGCRGQDSATPLHTAVALHSPYHALRRASLMVHLLDGASGTRKDAIDWLLGHGADINARRNDGKTPLHLAANIADVDIAEHLLAKGAKVGSTDGEGCTALHESVVCGSPDVARVLLGHGAVINSVDKLGWTPLHHAVSHGNREMVEFLVEHGAAVNQRTNESNPKTTKGPESWESKGGSLGLVSVISIPCSRMTPLHVAVLANGSPDPPNGQNGLDLTYRTIQVDIARYLIGEGKADPTVTAFGGLTPLHYASALRLCGYDMLELLIKSTPAKYLKAKTENGSTPYDMAVSNHNQTAVNLLKRHGAGR